MYGARSGGHLHHLAFQLSLHVHLNNLILGYVLVLTHCVAVRADLQQGGGGGGGAGYFAFLLLPCVPCILGYYCYIKLKASKRHKELADLRLQHILEKRGASQKIPEVLPPNGEWTGNFMQDYSQQYFSMDLKFTLNRESRLVEISGVGLDIISPFKIEGYAWYFSNLASHLMIINIHSTSLSFVSFFSLFSHLTFNL
eukprot:TRINITY_DN11041_c0_g1_i3.p1 TRINITY_DN11041_c0_g1~~TRINITY_DN11041_c0_g1_i3.p1  ORF type:complete len:216 (+),score=23.57 TRINITY_DN11041_c0_g1_i3:56-649(+)